MLGFCGTTHCWQRITFSLTWLQTNVNLTTWDWQSSGLQIDLFRGGGEHRCSLLERALQTCISLCHTSQICWLFPMGAHVLLKHWPVGVTCLWLTLRSPGFSSYWIDTYHMIQWSSSLLRGLGVFLSYSQSCSHSGVCCKVRRLKSYCPPGIWWRSCMKRYSPPTQPTER